MHWCNLVSIHIPPWGPIVKGPHHQTVWELIPTDLGPESPQELAALDSEDSNLSSWWPPNCWGWGWGRLYVLKCEWFSVEMGILAEKHLGKAPFISPLRDLPLNQNIFATNIRILKPRVPHPNLFSQRTHSYIERDFKSSALILSARLSSMRSMWSDLLRDSYRPLSFQGPEIGWVSSTVNLLGAVLPSAPAFLPMLPVFRWTFWCNRKVSVLLM